MHLNVSAFKPLRESSLYTSHLNTVGPGSLIWVKIFWPRKSSSAIGKILTWEHLVTYVCFHYPSFTYFPRVICNGNGPWWFLHKTLQHLNSVNKLKRRAAVCWFMRMDLACGGKANGWINGSAGEHIDRRVTYAPARAARILFFYSKSASSPGLTLVQSEKKRLRGRSSPRPAEEIRSLLSISPLTHESELIFDGCK